MKILLAVDGSKYTKKMLAYLATHSELFAVTHQYSLLHVQTALPMHVQNVIGKQNIKTYHAEEAEKVLAPAAKFLLRHGIQANTSWKIGHAGEQITKACADDHFDLLVMGSHGQGVLANMVMGSVATQVIAQSRVPVLLVR
jgi:nucleotide-binding universal stress UspA family protein